MNQNLLNQYAAQFDLLSDADHQEILKSLDQAKSMEDLCKIYCFARPFLNILKSVPVLGKYLEIVMKVLDNLCPQCVK